MINNSPNLVSLKIGIPHANLEWLNGLFGSLNVHFPALQTLKIRSQTCNIKSKVVSIGLCSFFERHPQLRTVYFDWPVSMRICAAAGQGGIDLTASQSPYSPSKGYTIPESYLDFERLFPSLESFAGNVLDCASVVKSSKLAGQLVELQVTDAFGQNLDYCYGIQSLAQAVSSLPKLQRFEYSGSFSPEATTAQDKGHLAKIVAACPELAFLKLISAQHTLVRLCFVSRPC